MTPENQMFWGQAVIDLYPNVTYMTDWVDAWDNDNNLRFKHHSNIHFFRNIYSIN